MNLFCSNDNRMLLVSAVAAATFWWQGAISFAEGNTAKTVVAPPVLPGQVGNTFDEAMRIGQTLLSKNEFPSAAANFQAAIGFNDKSAEAHLGFGQALLGEGKTEDSEREFFFALERKPALTQARFEWGRALMKKQCWDEAAGQFLQVIKITPDDLATRGNLGLCYQQKGQLDTAIEQFDYICKVKPNDAASHYNLANALYIKGNWLRALEEYKATIKCNPERPIPMSYVGMANCLLNLKHPEDAIKANKQELKLYPNNYMAYIALGRIYECQNRPLEAQQFYKRAIQMAPRAPECVQLAENMWREQARKLGITLPTGSTQ